MNKWHSIAQYQNADVDYAALCRYRQVRYALMVNEDGNLVLRDYQLVIPSTLQQRAVELAHERHQGMSKTKAFLRTKVWFTGADAAVEEAVRSCKPCQANTTRKSKEPLIMSALPRGPWLEVSIDVCGPLPTGEYLLVMVDEFSRYPIVELVRNTAAETVIPVVGDVCSTFDYPEVSKSATAQWSSLEGDPTGEWCQTSKDNSALATGQRTGRSLQQATNESAESCERQGHAVASRAETLLASIS